MGTVLMDNNCTRSIMHSIVLLVAESFPNSDANTYHGKDTTEFLGRLIISKIKTAEVETHADIVTTVRCLSLSPVVQNIDGQKRFQR